MHVQRWRLTFSRDAEAARLTPREQAAAWEATLAALGSVTGDGGGSGATDAAPGDRLKLVPAAPLPVGMTAAREMSDVMLPRRWTAAAFRERLEASFPAGHRVIDVHDVWIGAPSLPSLLVAGDYRITIGGDDDGPLPDHTMLLDGVSRMLAAPTIPRRRTRGDAQVIDDQRPLVIDVRAPEPACLWMRLRFDPVLGTGRPEDVVRALGETIGAALAPVQRHREGLWLRGEVDV